MSTSDLTVAELAGVVYSAGKVFDGLATGRLDTDNFLRSGSVEGIVSRADLNLLEDLRDCAQLIIDHAGRGIDADFACEVNAAIRRSGALHPGRLRTDPGIGVDTPYGRHQPPVLTAAELETIIESAMRGSSPREAAVGLFVNLARAQPFSDGNKRTALFVANAHLLGSVAGTVLTVPVGDIGRFNDLLARAYVFGEDAGVADLLYTEGFADVRR